MIMKVDLHISKSEHTARCSRLDLCIDAAEPFFSELTSLLSRHK